MTQRLWHQDEILAALAEGATVVTASERLARAAQLTYADAQLGAGLRAWERPRVLPWTAFLAQLVSAREDGLTGNAVPIKLPRLLSENQAEAAWEKVVRVSGAAQGLLQPLAAAQAAQEAWTLCHQYRLDPAHFAGTGGGDAEQFAAWAKTFRDRCRTENWLDAARLPDQLATWIEARCLLLPARIVFAGFDEWTPQQQQLVQSMQNAGCKIERLMMQPAAQRNARRVMCADTDHELRAAARWAGALLERNPEARIGIVVHDLSECRDRLKRILDETLCPSACLGGQPARPYNLSLGSPLTDAPVIHDALLLLRALAHGRPDFNTVSQMLRSPFLRGAESEFSTRARLELRLREGGERIPLTRLTGLARERGDVPELVTALVSCLDWQRKQPQRQPPSAWARSFAEVLRALGWPGERTRDSAEHQALEAFRNTLGELARLDAFSETLEMRECVSRLVQLAAQDIFQPAAEEVPVQVLGVLEATGLCFDHLWIAGWSDDVWPASPRPNPLIPVSLQRQHDMPHANARRELDFAQRISARLLASAPEVLVSAPQQDADQELRPSPLIAGLSQIGIDQIPQRDAPTFAQFLHAAAPRLETRDDRKGPELPERKVYGGTGILKSQAACAFQAFARYRLGAEPMAVPGPGLDPMQRGSLLHEVMYRLYGELADQAALAGQNETQLETLMRACVDAALDHAQARQPEIFAPHFLALERERLMRLLRGWLQVERARPPFRVEQREHQQTVNIGPLCLSTRVDRLDRLANGSYAIIDYKTSDVKPPAWQGERPDEPQLPCYAVTATNDVAAVLFAILRPGETGYRGYARSEQTVPGIPGFDNMRHPPDGCENWDALLSHWRRVLNRLAQEYAVGEASVAPKDRNRTCRFCHLAALCRIDETQARGEQDDADA